MTNKAGDSILAAYDAILAQHGDTAQGAHWPNEKDRIKRFEVMLGVMEDLGTEEAVLCDLACGTGALLTYLSSLGSTNIRYIGVDRSASALAYARAKHPAAHFLDLDVADPKADLTPMACDYLVCSGLFTVRFGVSNAEMWAFLERTIARIWPLVRKGLAFNVMSKCVDWEREGLFHVPMDDVARLLHRLAGRNVVLRADYGLYEYTAYAHRRPN